MDPGIGTVVGAYNRARRGLGIGMGGGGGLRGSWTGRGGTEDHVERRGM